MAKSTAVFLLAFSSLVPSVVSVPVLAPEECVCQPLEGQTSSNSSLASCNKIARDIQQWRAVAFHSPYMADAFVDAEQGLQVFRDGRALGKVQLAHKSGCHGPTSPRTIFDKAVGKLFQQWKKPTGDKAMSRTSSASENSTITHYFRPARLVWPWEHSKREDKSPGHVVEHGFTPSFLQPAQRHRILCRSRTSQGNYSFVRHPELMLLAGLILVVICMTIFDLVVVAWRGYKWVTHKSSIALVGDEKRIYAYEIERKGLDDTVVPAISDI